MTPAARSRTAIAAEPPLWVPMLSLWLLMLVCFSMPARESPTTVAGLDGIAVAKLLVRLVAIGSLSLVLAQHWQHPRRPLVTWCFLPLGLYVAWSILSAAWSPLRAVSLGQAAGLLALALLSAVIALCSTPQNTSRIVFHMVIPPLVFSAGLVLVDQINHDVSGLNRDLFTELEHTTGLIHPTTAGATASFGLCGLIAARLLWNWPWTRPLVIPAFVAHGLILVVANSRMAMGMAALLLVLMVWALLDRVWLAALLLAGSLTGAAYMAVDPELDVVGSVSDTAATKLQRGQTTEQIGMLSGRVELWEAILVEFQKSPLVGHGYFVTSETGLLDVWTGPSERTAHNVYLQVLVSTGVIGFVLFVWGLLRPLGLLIRGFLTPHGRAVAAFTLLMLLWYAGWSLLSESFMGPIQPESAFFFSLVGLSAGRLLRVESPALAGHAAHSAFGMHSVPS